jgi:predicted DNA-binding protein (MmcQ/YjbR family)
MKPKGCDQALERIRSICLALPETKEVQAWGHPTFRAGKKMFAAFGEVDSWGLSLGLKVGFDQQEELLKDHRFYPTPYAAHKGWVSLRIDGDTDWAQVEGLVHEAYRQVALRRMLRALEEQGAGEA